MTERWKPNVTVAAVIEREGHIDALVSNAGIGGGRALEETPIAEIREIYDTNFCGALAVMQEVIPHMRKRGSGRLVNTTSLAAVLDFAECARLGAGGGRPGGFPSGPIPCDLSINPCRRSADHTQMSIRDLFVPSVRTYEAFKNLVQIE